MTVMHYQPADRAVHFPRICSFHFIFMPCILAGSCHPTCLPNTHRSITLGKFWHISGEICPQQWTKWFLKIQIVFTFTFLILILLFKALQKYLLWLWIICWIYSPHSWICVLLLSPNLVSPSSKLRLYTRVHLIFIQ